jgi:hypothetical protein
VTRRCLRDRSDLVWATWLGSSLATFAVIETVAYRTGRPKTLSRSLCRWLGIYPATRWRHASVVAFIAAWLALVVHLETLDRPLPLRRPGHSPRKVTRWHS